MAALLTVQATDCVQPKVSVNELDVVAARVIRAVAESRYTPGAIDGKSITVALIDAAWVVFSTVPMRSGVLFNRSANESNQYRIACVTRPLMLDCTTGRSTTNSGVGAKTDDISPHP